MNDPEIQGRSCFVALILREAAGAGRAMLVIAVQGGTNRHFSDITDKLDIMHEPSGGHPSWQY
jgi:hypothetical protein